MKQDKLEQFIRKNRDDFDEHEPPFGLFDQIEARLDNNETSETQPEVKKVPLYKQKWIGIAAGILLPIIILSIVLNTVRTKGTPYDTEGTSIASYMYSEEYIEMTETELYYKREIEQKEEKLKTLVAYSPQLSHVVDETLVDLSESYASLNNDFQMNVNSEEMMNTIVNHQRMRLQTIEDLIQQIEMSKTH